MQTSRGPSPERLGLRSHRRPLTIWKILGAIPFTALESQFLVLSCIALLGHAFFFSPYLFVTYSRQQTLIIIVDGRHEGRRMGCATQWS